MPRKVIFCGKKCTKNRPLGKRANLDDSEVKELADEGEGAALGRGLLVGAGFARENVPPKPV
jgi:hypothetical protein